MTNYLLVSKQFNTGYLPDETDLRIKQGLAPQQITNACAYLPPTFTAYPAQGFPYGATCNNAALKPAKQVKWNYGMPEIPDSCPCTKYLQRI